MSRVAPSTRLRHEIAAMLSAGAEPGTNLLSALAGLGLCYLVQQGLEQGQEDFLGRGRYRRRGAAGLPGWRNGYEPGRLRTAEGRVAVELPQVRGADEPFRLRLLGFLDGDSAALEHLVTEMYARGLSTRDVEDCFRGPDGELLISRSAVSESTDQLWTDYELPRAGPLGRRRRYLFGDAIFESLRRHGAKEAVLAAWAITTEGRKVLLGLAVGNKESEAAWTEFLRDLVRRGLRAPTSVTADGRRASSPPSSRSSAPACGSAAGTTSSAPAGQAARRAGARGARPRPGGARRADPGGRPGAGRCGHRALRRPLPGGDSLSGRGPRRLARPPAPAAPPPRPRPDHQPHIR